MWMQTMNSKERDEAYRLYSEAHAAAESGQLTTALSFIDLAIRLRPNNPHYHLKRGRLLEKSRHFSEAVAEYLRAAELKPKWDEPWAAIGLLHFRNKQYGEARPALEMSVNLSPSADVFTMLSCILLNENPEKSLMYADQALELDPTWEEARNLRQDALSKLRHM